MKRFLFLMLIMSLAFACKTPAPEHNQNVNQTLNSNTNANVYVNTNANTGTFTMDDKAVAVIIHEKADGTGKEILVSEQKVKVRKDKVKLRFHVFNNLNEEIGNVRMMFDTTDPFDGPPPFETGGTLKAGDDKKTQPRKAKNISNGLYKYTISVFGPDGKPLPGLPPLDPQVEIVN